MAAELVDLRETLRDILHDYFSIGDSYTYELTRVKEAFEIGTMTFEDFEEWTDDNVTDLVEYIIDNLKRGGMCSA